MNVQNFWHMRLRLAKKISFDLKHFFFSVLKDGRTFGAKNWISFADVKSRKHFFFLKKLLKEISFSKVETFYIKDFENICLPLSALVKKNSRKYGLLEVRYLLGSWRNVHKYY